MLRSEDGEEDGVVLKVTRLRLRAAGYVAPSQKVSSDVGDEKDDESEGGDKQRQAIESLSSGNEDAEN